MVASRQESPETLLQPASRCLRHIAVGICVLAIVLGAGQPMTSRWKQQQKPLPTPRLPLCSRVRAPFICAHGGDTMQHPPNTAAAYNAALEAGADCMEIDAALTADGVLVALHDRDLAQLLGRPTARVQDWTWAELQDRAWPSGDHLLTVADAAAQVQQFVDLLIVDVKASDEINRVMPQASNEDGKPLSEAGALLEALQQLPHSNSTVIWGKSDELMVRIHKSGMPVLTGYTIMRAPGTPFEDPLRLATAMVAAVYHGVLDEDMMQVLRAQHKTVVPWTVDQRDDMARMLGLGVDGLVTNSPRLLRAMLQAALQQCVVTRPPPG